MPIRLTAYLPEGAAAECLVRTPSAVRIGRADDCALVLPHASVSREHAELSWLDAAGWQLRDLRSKNGSFVEGTRVSDATLPGSAWLRFGDVPCEFRQLDAAALDRADQRIALRYSASRMHTLRVQRQSGLADLLQSTLTAVVELAGCERGFLLLCQPDGLEVRAWHGLEFSALGQPAFSGSVGAVERALAGSEPLVLNDIARDAGLRDRASVVTGGLRTLVCVPLRFGDESLGLVYADSRQPGALVTTLDVELLTAFAERASLWIAARRSQQALADVDVLPWADVTSVHARAGDARP